MPDQPIIKPQITAPTAGSVNAEAALTPEEISKTPNNSASRKSGIDGPRKRCDRQPMIEEKKTTYEHTESMEAVAEETADVKVLTLNASDRKGDAGRSVEPMVRLLLPSTPIRRDEINADR